MYYRQYNGAKIIRHNHIFIRHSRATDVTALAAEFVKYANWKVSKGARLHFDPIKSSYTIVNRLKKQRCEIVETHFFFPSSSNVERANRELLAVYNRLSIMAGQSFKG